MAGKLMSLRGRRCPSGKRRLMRGHRGLGCRDPPPAEKLRKRPGEAGSEWSDGRFKRRRDAADRRCRMFRKQGSLLETGRRAHIAPLHRGAASLCKIGYSSGSLLLQARVCGGSVLPYRAAEAAVTGSGAAPAFSKFISQCAEPVERAISSDWPRVVQTRRAPCAGARRAGTKAGCLPADVPSRARSH